MFGRWRRRREIRHQATTMVCPACHSGRELEGHGNGESFVWTCNGCGQRFALLADVKDGPTRRPDGGRSWGKLSRYQWRRRQGPSE